MDRVNELTFNASLLSQMRTIDFINRLLADGRLQEGEGTKACCCTASTAARPWKTCLHRARCRPTAR
jgi:hypothetical protein